MFQNMYPYTDGHELNLDWILYEIRKLHADMTEFEALNKITFDGEWDITKQYPAWTIVNVNDTTGYISVKPVPAGINISNDDYWKLIVDYTITLADLQNRVVQLEKDVDKLKNRFYIFIGDSYSIGTSGGVPVTNFGWVDQVIKYLDLDPDSYVRCTQADIGGLPAFYPTTTGHQSWRDSIEIIHDRMTPEQIEKVTDVVCCGGYNESFGWNINDTIYGMQQYIAYVKEKFPGATYWLGEIGMQTGMSNAVIPGRDFIINKVIPCYSQAAEYGFRVMAGTDRILWNDTQTTDGIHPTEAVYEIIGKAIANNLLGTAAQLKYEEETHNVAITPTSAFSLAVGSGDFINYRHQDGSRELYYGYQQLAYNLTTPQALAAYTLLQLGTYDTTYMAGKGQTMIDVPFMVTLANNNKVLGMATLYIGSGIIMFCHNIDTAFYGGSNVTRITFGPFRAAAQYPELL